MRIESNNSGSVTLSHRNEAGPNVGVSSGNGYFELDIWKYYAITLDYDFENY